MSLFEGVGSNEGRAWMSLGGVGHVELSEGFFGLTPRSLVYDYILEEARTLIWRNHIS